MTTPQEIERFQRQLQDSITKAMDALAQEMAAQLKREFGNMLEANDESWLLAATGIVRNMNFSVEGWLDYNNMPYMLANFPVSGERLPLYAMKRIDR